MSGPPAPRCRAEQAHVNVDDPMDVPAGQRAEPVPGGRMASPRASPGIMTPDPAGSVPSTGSEGPAARPVDRRPGMPGPAIT